MEKQKKNLDKKKIEYIKKELDKIDVNWNSLSPRVQELLLKAEYFYENQEEIFNEKMKNIVNLKVNILSFSNYLGVHRNMFYKKNSNGNNNYNIIIKYINMKSSKFDSLKKNIIKEYLKSKDKDQKLMEQLLKRDVDYMNLKQQLKEKDEYIKELKM